MFVATVVEQLNPNWLGVIVSYSFCHFYPYFTEETGESIAAPAAAEGHPDRCMAGTYCTTWLVWVVYGCGQQVGNMLINCYLNG